MSVGARGFIFDKKVICFIKNDIKSAYSGFVSSLVLIFNIKI